MPTFITSKISPFKTELSPFSPLSESARAFEQNQVDEIGNNFVRAVARGRGVAESTVTTLFGKGRTLLAPAAHRVGMVDDIETLDRVLSGMASGSQRRGAAIRATSPRVASHNPRHRWLEDHRHGDPSASPRQNLIRVLERQGDDEENIRRDTRYWQRRIDEEKR